MVYCLKCDFEIKIAATLLHASKNDFNYKRNSPFVHVENIHVGLYMKDVYMLLSFKMQS